MGVGAIAAAFPDSDFLLGYVSELTYLQAPRCHAFIVAAAAVGVLLAWLTSRLYRLGGREGPSWRRIYPLACAALFVHILGDLITQFGTMIPAPFSDRRFGLGTTFIIDLVLSGRWSPGLSPRAVFVAAACRQRWACWRWWPGSGSVQWVAAKPSRPPR